MAEYRLSIHPAAAADAESAHAWYTERNPAAGAQFLVNLDIAIGRILGSPNRWPRVFGDYRRFILPKFPFSVVYRTVANEIEVIVHRSPQTAPAILGAASLTLEPRGCRRSLRTRPHPEAPNKAV